MRFAGNYRKAPSTSYAHLPRPTTIPRLAEDPSKLRQTGAAFRRSGQLGKKRARSCDSDKSSRQAVDYEFYVFDCKEFGLVIEGPALQSVGQIWLQETASHQRLICPSLIV